MGHKVASELEGWRAIQEAVGHGGREAIEPFVEDGDWLYSNLQALVHGEPVQEGFSNRKVAKWLAFSRRSRTTIGRRMLHGAEPGDR